MTQLLRFILKNAKNQMQNPGLNGLAYGRDLTEGAFIVACLKRALGHLHAAQAALEKVAPRKMLPNETVKSVRTELFEIREKILKLMDEFRGGT